MQIVRLLAHVCEFRPNRLQVLPQRLGPVRAENTDNASFELRYERLGNANDLLSAVCGENEFGATVAGIGNPCQIAVRLEVLHQFGHCLLGHLSSLGEGTDGSSGIVDELKDHAMRRSYRIMSLRYQSGNDYVVEGDKGFPHQHGQIGRPFMASEIRNTSPPSRGETPHTVRNESEAVAVAFVVHAPGAPMENFSREAALAATDPPDMDVVLAIAQRHGIELLGPIPTLVGA